MMQRVTRFPSRTYHFIWRNWDLVPARRIASFLGAPVARVRVMANDLGLGGQPPYLAAHRLRLRGLIIRRNWHLLPMPQLEKLLGVRGSMLDKFVREHDFLNHKLPPKPRCAALSYRAPSPAHRAAARRMGKDLAEIGEPADQEPSFAFLDSLRRGRAHVSPPPPPKNARWLFAPRIMHPFDAPHDFTAFLPENSPLPYLRLLRDFGADALWFPAVVSDLVSLAGYPEFGHKRSAVLPRLRAFIRRAAKAGLGTYLYICEPRGQSIDFFRDRPELRGVPALNNAGIYHICTSTDKGRDLVRGSIRELCGALPGLAGLIDISASEYPTHCYSHGNGADCPRCGPRRPADVLAELLQTMQEGIDDSGSKAELIAWNWGWQWALKKRKKLRESDITRLPLASDARDYIFRKLPGKVTPLLNFEYGTRVRRGGTENRVWEYAISQPKQGPYTAIQKRAIDRLGRRALARIHVSNSTEFLGAPYIPALHLVAEKFQSLRENGYDGFMGSWIFGGYPSPNLLLARELSLAKKPDPRKALRGVASLYYGRKNADTVVKAWGHFSEAFRHYPFSIPFQYSSPLHLAPAAEWPLKPTGQPSLMYCPSDDPKHYSRPYDPATIQNAFTRIASRWEEGLVLLKQARDAAGPAHRRAAERDYGIAETFSLCCKALLNHVRFCDLRLKARRSRKVRRELRALIEDEIRLAKRYYKRMRSDSRIAFEASMQYFVLPNDVRETLLGLHQRLRDLDKLDARRVRKCNT